MSIARLDEVRAAFREALADAAATLSWSNASGWPTPDSAPACCATSRPRCATSRRGEARVRRRLNELKAEIQEALAESPAHRA